MTQPMKILRVDSSAKTKNSESRRLTDRIINGLKTNGKSLDVTVRDLNYSLPQVNTAWIEANNTPSDDQTDEHKKTLALSDTLVAEIEAADTLIIGVALYNFSITASLKLWIDLVCRARKTFAYVDGSPKGLMTGKKAIICFASGGTPFESNIDFASGYLRHILGFIGITDVTFISADKHFMDDQSLFNANAAVDTLTNQLLTQTS
ncbi:NAD(P)H-dependent oxidoreductase [Candidatus Pelagibacter sp.]|jgi:FMN-dependent NADH-azoreductase|nr:NAD(P)H-dependent oxidoreductase [Candidatus Pelagibacter sp.]